MALIDRFFAKVSPEPNSGCWLWSGADNGKGYGVILSEGGKAGRMMLAHRVSYELHCEPIPAEMEIDHLCRMPCCVNPEHLEPVTHAENMRRGTAGKHQSSKTACPKGHPYSEENTSLYGKFRRCRECKREYNRHRPSRAKGASQ